MPPATSLEFQMQEHMKEMRTSMTLIAEAITRLAVLEERHTNTSTALTKLNDKVEALEGRERTTELEQAKEVAKVKATHSTLKIVWTVVGGALTYLATKFIPLLFNSPHGA